MRYLILSDIHGNWEALEATLKDAARRYDDIVCCGDLVGYGADPNAVTDWVRKNIRAVVRGNHDRAAVGLDDLEWFNPYARAAAEWTEASLSKENHAYLRDLPVGPLTVDGFQLLHGSPVDEDEYLVSEDDVSYVVADLEADLAFFGHTHLQSAYQCHGRGILHKDGPQHHERKRVFELETESRYMVNPGSVGQPRDRDWRAAYAIYDSASRKVTLVRVEYDLRTAQQKIVDAGLPPLLAHRLENGT